MAKILFVDDRLDEVIHQWKFSGCANHHELLPLEPFVSIERTCQIVNTFKPDIVVVGYGLGKGTITGADVIQTLRGGGYNGYVVANSGSGKKQFSRVGIEVDGSANRNPHDLKMVVDNLVERRRKCV